MRHFKQAALGFAAIVSGLAGASGAEASYFVRPYIGIGGGATIDGYQVNGSTVASANFGTDLQVTSDLGNGNVRSYLHLFGPDQFAQVLGSFGDTIVFNGDAVGTQASFSNAFDGHFTADATFPQLDSNIQFGVFATLYVYEAGHGVNGLNFGLAEFDAYKVVGDTRFLSYSPTNGFDADIADVLSGSFTVGAAGAYDVFSSLNIFASTNGQPISITGDFLHTAQLDITTEPGVTYTSDSTVLLSGRNIIQSPVPEPATWAMMIGGFGLVGGSMRRRRSVSVSFA